MMEPERWGRLDTDQKKTIEAAILSLQRKVREQRLEASLKDAKKTRKRLLDSYEYFYRQAWEWVEDSPLVWSDHQDLVCRYMQALREGKLFKDLLVNIPPGCGKSINVGVIFVAWAFAHNPSEKIAKVSYDEDLLTEEQGEKLKRLIESEWYQAFFGDRVSIDPKSNNKKRWSTTAGGWVFSTTPNGKFTGRHPSLVIIDDPHNVKQAENDGQRDYVCKQWFDKTLSSRGAGETLGRRRVIVMQRLHEEDLSGHVLKIGGWAHVCLPMRYEEGAMKDEFGIGSDKRVKPGQLLWEAMFPEKKVSELERALGVDRWGQLQQRPVSKTGGIFLPDRIKIVPESAIPWSKIHYFKRAWDRAGTKDAGDYTAGVLMGIYKPNLWDKSKPDETIIYILDVIREQWSTGTVQRQIELWARLDENKFGFERMETVVEQEPASSGKKVAVDTIANLRGHRARAVKPMTNKIVRAEPLANAMEAYEVVMVEAKWNADFISEIRAFPRGAHDDQVDASAMCYLEMTNPNRNDFVFEDDDIDEDDIEIALPVCANRMCGRKRRVDDEYCCECCKESESLGVEIEASQHDRHCIHRHADLLNRDLWEPPSRIN